MKRILLPFVLLMLSSGCSQTSSDTSSETQPTALVKLASATTGDIAQSVTLYGEIDHGGDSQVVLSAPMEAVVMAVDAPAGSSVKAGQVVARLKASPASMAQVRAASADAIAASQALARAQRLRRDELASDADVESARSRSIATSTLLASYNQRSSMLILRAPGASFVDTIGASTGDLVQPGAPIATLSRSGKITARFGIDPSLLRSLGTKQPIEIHPSDGSPPFVVPITNISPVAHAQTRLASLTVTIPAQYGLAAGQSLSAKVVTRSTQSGTTVSYAALLDDGGQSFVYVVKNGVAHRQDVTVGASDAKRAEILKGLAYGDAVVIEGGTGVEDGIKVRTK